MGEAGSETTLDAYGARSDPTTLVVIGNNMAVVSSNGDIYDILQRQPSFLRRTVNKHKIANKKAWIVIITNKGNGTFTAMNIYINKYSNYLLRTVLINSSFIMNYYRNRKNWRKTIFHVICDRKAPGPVLFQSFSFFRRTL